MNLYKNYTSKIPILNKKMYFGYHNHFQHTQVKIHQQGGLQDNAGGHVVHGYTFDLQSQTCTKDPLYLYDGSRLKRKGCYFMMLT